MDSRIKNSGFKDRLMNGRTLTYILMTMFCTGELAGTVLYLAFQSGRLEAAGNILEKFFYNRMGCTFIQTVVNSFSGTFILMLCCMILGFGAVFQPIEISVPFFHGLGIGIVLAEMNGSYGFTGFWTSAIMIFPYSVVSAVIVIISAKESVMMSSAVCKNVFGGKSRTEIDVRLYAEKFLILLSAAALCSLIDGLTTYLFAGLWTRLLGI